MKNKLLHGVVYEPGVEIREHEPIFCKGAFKNMCLLVYWGAVAHFTVYLIKLVSIVH